MPQLLTPALPAGHLNRLPQPSLRLDGHLSLRPWREADARAVHEAFGCPAIQRWHTLRMDGEAEALDWIAGWQKRWQEEKAVSWAIADGPDGRPLGQVGLRNLSLFEANAAVSYWMLPAARGRGIAAQAVEAMTSWALETLGLIRLSLVHSVANSASCRVATKAGFEPEGTLRRSMLHTDGWHDMHLHARLRPS